MKKLLLGAVAFGALLAQPVLAADMPLKAPVAAPVVIGWAGFYVGLNAGYGWGRTRAEHNPNDQATANFFSFNGPSSGGTPPGPVQFDHNGGLGGFQVGYNWRPDRYTVFGFEADFDWADLRGSGTSNFLFIPNVLVPIGLNPASNVVSDHHVKYFGTVRARVGFTPVDNVLLYGTAGWAYAGVDQNGSVTLGSGITAAAFGVVGFTCAPNVPCFLGSSSHTVYGWTGGAGAEIALWNNVSVKAEYLYMTFGGESNRVTAVAANPGLALSSISTTYKFDLHVARIGINYRFGWEPAVVAKY